MSWPGIEFGLVLVGVTRYFGTVPAEAEGIVFRCLRLMRRWPLAAPVPKSAVRGKAVFGGYKRFSNT